MNCPVARLAGWCPVARLRGWCSVARVGGWCLVARLGGLCPLARMGGWFPSSCGKDCYLVDCKAQCCPPCFKKQEYLCYKHTQLYVKMLKILVPFWLWGRLLSC